MGQVGEPKIARFVPKESMAIRGDVEVAGVGFPGQARQGRRTALTNCAFRSIGGIALEQGPPRGYLAWNAVGSGLGIWRMAENLWQANATSARSPEVGLAPKTAEILF